MSHHIHTVDLSTHSADNNNRNSPSFRLSFLCVYRQRLELSLARLVLPWDLLRLSPLVPLLFYEVQSVELSVIYSLDVKVKQDDLFRPKKQTVGKESTPLMNPAHWRTGWALRPLSETVCHCSPWSSQSGNALSRGRCWQLGQSFSSPGCAPICWRAVACWVETWYTGEGGDGFKPGRRFPAITAVKEMSHKQVSGRRGGKLCFLRNIKQNSWLS